MHTWFECKIKYEKVIEEVKTLTVNETYLIDSLSFYRSRKEDYSGNGAHISR